MCCLCDPWHITWTDLVDTFAQFSSFECSSSANALFLASFYRLAVVWFVLLWLFIDRYLYFLFAIYLDTIYFIPFLNHCGKFLLHQKDPTHFGTSVLTNFFFGQKRSTPNNFSKQQLEKTALRLSGRCGSFWIRRRRSRRRSHRRCWGPACRCRNETGGAETGRNRNGRDMTVTRCGWHIDVRWWWRCGMIVVSLVALLFDDFWSSSQLGRLALLGVEIVLSGVVRAKGPALPPWLPRLHGFSDHDKSERVKLL